MTRLLNTPIIGPSTAIVDSSWIDMLAGLVINGIRNVPPVSARSAGETKARQLSADNSGNPLTAPKIPKIHGRPP